MSDDFLPRVTNGDSVVMSKLDSCVRETAEQQVLTEYWDKPIQRGTERIKIALQNMVETTLPDEFETSG